MSERIVRVPPLSFNTSGSTTDIIVDRLALNLRAKFPYVLGDKALDEIALMFADLRGEIARMIDTHSHEED